MQGSARNHSSKTSIYHRKLHILTQSKRLCAGNIEKLRNIETTPYLTFFVEVNANAKISYLKTHRKVLPHI